MYFTMYYKNSNALQMCEIIYQYASMYYKATVQHSFMLFLLICLPCPCFQVRTTIMSYLRLTLSILFLMHWCIGLYIGVEFVRRPRASCEHCALCENLYCTWTVYILPPLTSPGLHHRYLLPVFLLPIKITWALYLFLKIMPSSYCASNSQ